MRDTFTVDVPSELRAQVDSYAAERGLTRGGIVHDALREYLFFRPSRDIRRRMSVEAQAQGLFTAADVFERVS
jgi:predicted transcriptional regulator